MTDLKLSEVILAQRKARNMTQEELAAELGVTAQAVSNWERGGYPDITMLPGIANYFGITVDELIGNDALSQEEDIRKFFRLIREELPSDDMAQRLRLGKEYVRKYPRNYDIAHELCWIINWSDKDVQRENLPLLRDMCRKIMDGCTVQTYRESAVRLMCTLGTDEDWETWSEMCAGDYKAYRGEVLEERLLTQERYDECVLRKGANKLELFCHMMSSNCGNWHDPDRVLAWCEYRIGLMKSFGKNGEIPAAWQGWYAMNLTYMADHLFRAGRDEEGYAHLEKAYDTFETWVTIPAGEALDVGHDWMFHGVRALKNKWTFQFPDGRDEYSNYMHIFTDHRDFLYTVMTMTQNWNGFDRVREDARYRDLLEKAEKLAKS